MGWKPPPMFGGDNQEKSDREAPPMAMDATWKASKATAIEKTAGEGYNPSVLGSFPPPARRNSLESIAWRPPASFATIAEGTEERVDNDDNDDEGEATKQTAEKETGATTEIVARNRSGENKCGIDPGPTPNGVGTVETEDRSIIGRHAMDGNGKRTRTLAAEDFRPFWNDIARYVVSKGAKTDDGAITTLKEQLRSGNHRNTLGKPEDEEMILFEALTAAMEEGGGKFCGMDRTQLQTQTQAQAQAQAQAPSNERELFALWEGVRLAVCATNRLAAFFSEISAPQAVPPPKRFPSMRAMSIAHARKQCDAVLSSNDRPASSRREKKEANPSTSLAASTAAAAVAAAAAAPESHQRRLGSLRAMSIALIHRERCVTVDDATNAPTAAIDQNQIDAKGDASKIKKLLEELEEAEKYQRRLEQQLQKAGVVIAEDIPYDVAKQKVFQIGQRMGELHSGGDGGDNGREYFKLEQEMEKYIAALELTEEWIEEQAEDERKWEAAMEEENNLALKRVLRHMPVDVRNRGELQLRASPTPNGRYISRSIAQKFKRTNCLQLLRTDPNEMTRWHPAMFENLRVTGLTLTERRALHHHLKTLGYHWKEQSGGSGDKMTERKLVWFETLKTNFRDSLLAYERHINRYGPPENHNCPMIGRQCPLEADKTIDYSGDYGYPENSEYFEETNDDVSKSNSDGGTEPTEEKKSMLCSTSISRENARGEKERGAGVDPILSHGQDLRREGELSELQGLDRGRGGRGTGRGGLINEIQGRGRGGRGMGRGGLLNEIQGRGHVGRGRGEGGLGGRGGLLAAIQSRAKETKRNQQW